MPKLFKRKGKSGFTLVEILAVVLLISVLAAIVLPTYQKYVLKSRAAEALNLLEMTKARQRVAVSKSQTNSYISQAASLKPLTISATEVSFGADLVVNSDYTITLNNTNQCATVIYKPNNQEKFRFSASYTQPGIACSGSICSSFTSVTTDLASVCRVPTEPGSNCIRPVEDCELGTIWSNTACSCVVCPACQTGYSYSGNGCQCVPDSCPSCISNKVIAPTEEDSCNCECPSDLPYWNEEEQICQENISPTECEECPGDKILIPTISNPCNCACPTDKPIAGANDRCLNCSDVCSSSVIMSWNGEKCVGTCPQGKIWNGSACVSCFTLYGESRPVWVAGANLNVSENALCSVKYNGSCEPCPSTEPIWDGQKCVACYELKTSTLISQYGNGPIYKDGRCVSCYEAYGAGAPVWDSASKNCISCAQANPAKVICSSGGGGGNMGGVVGPVAPNTDELEIGLGTSLPTRFQDFLADYNSHNINAYAFKSKALLAAGNKPNCGSTDSGATMGYIDTTPQCTAVGQITPCLYNCVPLPPNAVGIEEPCGATLQNGGFGQCYCDVALGRFVCPPKCDIIEEGSYFINYTPPICNLTNVSSCNLSILSSLGSQGNCVDSWHNATQYIPIKPVWVVDASNTTTGGYCAPCGSVTITPCSVANNCGGETRDRFSGPIWNGSSCQTLNNFTLVSQKCITMEITPVVECQAQNSCNAACYWGRNMDGGYICFGGNVQVLKKSSAATSIQNILGTGNTGTVRQAYHSPYNKEYYAITRLGISPGLESTVVVQ